MAGDRSLNESILHVLRPYASNWSGTLGRGDLVIPQREIPRLINDILNAVREAGGQKQEVTEAELFHALNEARRRPSLQDQAAYLLSQFAIYKR